MDEPATAFDTADTADSAATADRADTAQTDSLAPTESMAASETVWLSKSDTAAKPFERTEFEPASPRPPRLAGGLIAALLVLLLGVGAMTYFAVSWGDQLVRSKTAQPKVKPASASGVQANADARLAALRAARQFAVSFFTYDYRKVDAYFRRIEAASTGPFRADFISKEKALKPLLLQLKTVATGEVPDAGSGIFALADNKAVALVSPNLKESNAVTKSGQRPYRFKVSLQLIKGTWLVSDYQQVI